MSRAKRRHLVVSLGEPRKMGGFIPGIWRD